VIGPFRLALARSAAMEPCRRHTGAGGRGVVDAER
jgi:hypothetical protein